MLKAILKHKLEILIFIFGAAYFLFFSRYGIDIDDEGFHLYVSNLILKGFVPYRDFILHVTPASFYLQAFIFKIFAPTVLAGRLTVVVLGLYITMLLFRISRRVVGSDYFAAISSVLFIFWGVPHIRHPWYGWYGLASGLTFLYFCLKYLDSGRISALFFAGLFCGLTFLMKQNLGMACLVSYALFLMISAVFSRKDTPSDFLKRQPAFILGAIFAPGLCALYFLVKKSGAAFLYYTFKFAAFSAGGRLIFNPFPHVKSASVMILLALLLFAWLLYNCFWGPSGRKRIFLLLSALFASILITGMALFIIKINNVDKIYILDRVKMGAVNGFFNLAMLAVLFSAFIILKKIFEKKYADEKDGKLLFIVLFSLFYIWASLCISRDHLHLVLGMPPAYILLSFMIYAGVQKARDLLVRRHRDNSSARQYANLAFCAFPLIVMVYFGFFTALKNEGFRSISPPLVNMHSRLELSRARGILVTEEDKDMIEGVAGYVESHASKDERIFDTYKSSLFYFLSDRVHPSFYYILHTDLFRPDKQERVINDIMRYNIKLVITGKDVWDNLVYYADERRNPLTFRILRYVRDNFKIDKGFGRYYILMRKI